MKLKKTITLLGIPINVVRRGKAMDEFLSYCDNSFSDLNKQYFTATPNAEILLEAQKNEKLKNYLQKCSLNLADTVSLLWAAECQEKNWGIIRAIFELIFLPFRKSRWTVLPERVSGSDFFVEVCKSSRNLKIFLLGGAEGVAKKTRDVLEEKYPHINIVGAIAGSPLGKDDEVVVAKITEVQPDILFIAYGCPKQELWIARNLEKCTSAKVAMGIGGTFDFVAGKIKRAPKIFQNLGLEWLWRLVLQPGRAKRIFQAVIVFPFVFLKNRYKKIDQTN